MDRTNKADKLFLGHIITQDPRDPMFEALTVKDGLIQYVGSERVARELCDDKTVVMDYGDNYIYPGMIEAHAHGDMAGQRLKLQVDVSAGQNLEEYVELLKKYMEENPDFDEYRGAGFIDRGVAPTRHMLDEICPDKPMYVNSSDGHSMWMNTAALNAQGIDKAAADKWGHQVVRVEADGEPTGYISEGPVNSILVSAKYTKEQWKNALLAWQDFAFAHGYTAFMHAGIKENTCAIINELVEEGKWKLRDFAVYMVPETLDDYVPMVAEAAECQEKYGSEYLNIIGMKIFMDGVVEAHTAWLLEEYSDETGGFGVKRACERDKVVPMMRAAEKEGFNVHCHTIGDGAIQFALDCIEEVQLETGNMDMRNALAHLQVVTEEQIQRIADLNVVAVVAPLWAPKTKDFTPTEIAYVGEERVETSYPLKSFYDRNAIVTFHTDFPVSPIVDIPRSIYTAVMRKNPDTGVELQRNAAEGISRHQALDALTAGAAYSVKMEDWLGKLMIGYIPNMTIYDKNFIEDDIEEVAKAKLVATIVDGEEVYRA